MENRAFVWLMYHHGEISDSMGVHDLDKEFCRLCELNGYSAKVQAHHGDGVAIVDVDHRGSGVHTAMPQPGDCPAREITDKEVDALMWKWSLQLAPVAMIKDMALQLADGVLPKIIKEYNERESFRNLSDGITRRPKRFVLCDDAKVDHKKEAVEDFLSWIEEQYGEHMVARIHKSRGRIPYGTFVAYVRNHWRLKSVH